MTLNQFMFIGNAGADAELKFTQNGDQFAEFDVAVSRSQLVNGEWQTISTEWVQVAQWGRAAETTANSVLKGNRVFVEGRLSTSPYTAKNGDVRAGLKLSAFKVINLTQAGAEGAAQSQQARPPQEQDPEDAALQEDVESGEDLPW